MKLLTLITLCLVLTTPVLAAEKHPAPTTAQTVAQSASSVANHAIDGSTSVVNKAIDKLSDGVSYVAHTVEKNAPAALTMAVHGVFTIGASNLLCGLILFLICLGMWTMMFYSASKANWDSGNFYCFSCIVSGLMGSVIFIISLTFMCSPDDWARVISPDGYLAQQIINKVIK